MPFFRISRGMGEPNARSSRLVIMSRVSFCRSQNFQRSRRRSVPPGILIIALAVQSCMAPAVKGYYTPEETYQNASVLVGRVITVKGKLEIVSSACTQAVCPPENPCCNSCNYQLGFRLDKYRSIYLHGINSGCPGNSCRAECRSIQPGKTYRITGNLRILAGIIYFLDLGQWEPID